MTKPLYFRLRWQKRQKVVLNTDACGPRVSGDCHWKCSVDIRRAFKKSDTFTWIYNKKMHRVIFSRKFYTRFHIKIKRICLKLKKKTAFLHQCLLIDICSRKWMVNVQCNISLYCSVLLHCVIHQDNNFLRKFIISFPQTNQGNTNYLFCSSWFISVKLIGIR